MHPTLRAPERLSEAPERLLRGLGEACSFSTERGNKVGRSEAPKRTSGPVVPDGPLGRDGETTIKIKFAVSRGGGALGEREANRPKTLVFVGNATTIKF